MKQLIIVLAACSAHPKDLATSSDAAVSSSDGNHAGADGASEPEPLIPLVVGHTWQSTQTTSGAGGPTTTCDLTETVTGQMMVDGRDAFVLVDDFTCPTASQSSTAYTAALGGDHYESRQATATDGIWYVTDPPSEGHQWASDPAGMYVFTWHSVAAITVPAGSFTDCWRSVTNVGGSDQESTYCRGVGLVAADDSFTTGYTLQRRLVTKNF